MQRREKAMSTDAATVNQRSKGRVRKMVQIAMLSAIAVILMAFEIPLPFAPSFYKIDFSEVPVLIGCFAMGPAAGVAIEFLKILLHMLIHGTTTAGVGDLANFLVGCALVLPAALIYKSKKTRTGAIIGVITGTLFMIVTGCFMNAFVLLPVYAKAFGMPIDALVGMGTAVNSHITSLTTFVLFAVAPFNLIKGVLVCLIVFLIYKKVSPVLKMGA
jgi:riboflavin transporter FmnP